MFKSQHYKRVEYCVQCGKSAGYRCSKCSTPFCSTDCQRQAHPVHRNTCQKYGTPHYAIICIVVREDGTYYRMVEYLSEDKSVATAVYNGYLAAIQTHKEGLESGETMGIQEIILAEYLSHTLKNLKFKDNLFSFTAREKGWAGPDCVTGKYIKIGDKITYILG